MRLDHTIVPSRDKEVSSQFYMSIMGFKFGGVLGSAALVHVDENLTLRCDDRHSHKAHLAFHVTGEEFTQVLVRLKDEGVSYGATGSNLDMQVGQYAGGPRVYFADPAGNSIELMTVPTIRDAQP